MSASARRIFLTVWEDNKPALRLYESFGFERVGTTRVTIADKDVGEDLVMMLDKRRRGRDAPSNGDDHASSAASSTKGAGTDR